MYGTAFNARLFYLIGASGAGKDSLIEAARERMAGSSNVRFAVRYVTRPRHAGGERHRPLSAEEFKRRRRRGDFLLAWESHGLCYGIDHQAADWLAEGRDVVVNGSRGYLAEARRRVPGHLIPVVVTVRPEVLRERLRRRGRESEVEIEDRLGRSRTLAGALPEDAVVIDNNSRLAEAVDRFHALLTRVPAR